MPSEDSKKLSKFAWEGPEIIPDRNIVQEDTPLIDEDGNEINKKIAINADLGGANEVPPGDWGDDVEANKALMSFPDYDYIYPDDDDKALQETIPPGAPDDHFAYPKARKLYIGDPSSPDQTHLAAAITALQKGGLEGHKVQIPKEDKKAAVAKIRHAVSRIMDKNKKEHLLGRLKDTGFVSEQVVLHFTSQFKGNFPKVPTFPDVDIASLTQGDNDTRKYVTLPIAQVGAVSENGLLYDNDLVNSILTQINDKRPAGLQGHIPQEEKATAFPLPVGIWVGALLRDGILWAKAYLFPGPFREYVKAISAARGTLATSIYGDGDFESVPGSPNVRKCLDLDLQTIDFAPADRASLVVGDGKQFELTSEFRDNKKHGVKHHTGVKEMAGDTQNFPVEAEGGAGGLGEEGINPKDIENAMGNWEENLLLQHGANVAREMGGACRELHAQHVVGLMGPEEMSRHFGHLAEKFGGVKEIAQALGPDRVKGLAELYNTSNNPALVSTAAMGDEGHIAGEVKEMKVMRDSLSEMANELKTLRADKFKTAIDGEINKYLGDWNVSDPKHKEMFAVLQSTFKKSIVAEMAGSQDSNTLPNAAKTAWDGDVHVLAESFKISMAGPNAYVGIGDKKPDGTLATPEEAAKARANLGF